MCEIWAFRYFWPTRTGNHLRNDDRAVAFDLRSTLDRFPGLKISRMATATCRPMPRARTRQWQLLSAPTPSHTRFRRTGGAATRPQTGNYGDCEAVHIHGRITAASWAPALKGRAQITNG